MDSGETHYLFKETRLNLEPPAPGSVVTIRVPSGASSSRTSQKALRDSPGDHETIFRRQNLANAAGIYHRQYHTSPRSFLWRVLDDGGLLSIRVVDVCKKDVKTPDALLVLNLQFSTPIQPGCVALSDPQEHDALYVYVLDQACQLFSFTLRPDFFRKRAPQDVSPSELGAKVQAPAGLGFKHPHRLVAVDQDTLLVTVNDGGMIRFDKQTAGSGAKGLFRETFFNVQGWAQNLRSMLPFHGTHTLKHGKTKMEYSTATAIQVTSLGLEGCLFAITICLDHRMRIWNLDDGQILYTGDILNVERAPQDVGKWFIDPSQTNLLQLSGDQRGQRSCATYSPVGVGEFKFWTIMAKDSHTIVVKDRFPQDHFPAITPSSSDVWTMADFILSQPLGEQPQLWVLWKNNMTYRVQRRDLDGLTMAGTWAEEWDGVHVESGIVTAPNSGPGDPTDVTEKWLGTILQPGRFTKATLETALSIYEEGLGAKRENGKGRGLAESICTVLGSTASLERTSQGEMDYEQFRSSSESQWRRFYRLLIELNKQRGEALGLMLDPQVGMAWVVCADYLSAIRQCSDLERLYYNNNSIPQGQHEKADLVLSALSFFDGLPDNFVQLCEAAIRPELFEESTKTDMERIQYFYDKSAFWRGITDEDCAQIVDVLGPNFSTVTSQLYRDILGLMTSPPELATRKLTQPVSDLGRKLVMKAVRETIDLQWKVYLSQLVLLVHMEFEPENDDDALHNRVDIGQVYRQLIGALRRLELLRWLVKTELPSPLFRGEKPAGKRSDDVQMLTALEVNVGHLLGFDDLKDETLALCLTDIVVGLCAPDSDIEVSTSLIQCALIKRERADLASELTPFCDQEPFSVYVQGRVMLALRDYAAAAVEFRKAAIGMSTQSKKLERHSSGLLDETEWNLLNSGIPNYYAHIVSLFDRQRAYYYVTDFARLALQLISTRFEDAATKKEMLSRMFHAAIQTSQFELAHTSLTSMQDKGLRYSSLQTMVDKMCETYHNIELVALPFPGMQQEVDDILAERCKTTKDVQGYFYHQVLYALRIKRNNYRGAASVLLDRIQKLRLAGEGDRISGDDMLDTPLTRQYLLLINALSCVDPKQAWVFDEGGDARKVVSLADIRRQYQYELDRIAAIQNNQFGFEADDVMEVA